MGKSAKRHTRKIRRQNNAVLKYGSSAKPTHKALSGRTGRVMAKKLQSRKAR